MKNPNTHFTLSRLLVTGLVLVPSLSFADLPFTEDFETIPEAAENVPNVVLTSRAPIEEWYNHYDNAGWQVGAEEGDLSVAIFPADNSNNRWPETSTPARSSALRVGWAYESVKTIIALDLEDKWDSSKDYELTFQWALANHGSLTGRNFKAMIYGCPSYQYNIFGPTGPVPVEGVRSYPLDGSSSPRGALIKEVNLDPLGETPFGEVQNQTILISGADIEAANQNGSQIYFGFHKGANTEFLMVDNVTFQEAGTEPEPEPKMPKLGIGQSAGGLQLSWVGNPGMLYRIRSTNDLSAAVSSWPIVEEGISSDPSLNTKELSTEESSQFYILEEYPDPNLP